MTTAPAPITEIEEMLSTAYVARTMNVTTETVRNWIVENKLRAIRVHRHWRIPKSAFTDFLNDRHGANGATTVNGQGQVVGR